MIIMASKITAAALQYSKKLSRFICWVWAIYRFTVLIISAIQPSIATAVVETIVGLDTIMMFNVGTYLVNSLGEKVIYSDKFVLQWLSKKGFNSLFSCLHQNKKEEDSTATSDEESTEEGENG